MLVTQTPLTASQSTQYRQYRQYRHSVQAVRVPSCLQDMSIFEEAPLRYIVHWPKTVSVIFLSQYCTPQKYFLQFCGSFRRHYLDLFCTLRHIPPRLCGLRQLLDSRNSRCSSSRAEDSGSENMKWMKVKSGGAIKLFSQFRDCKLITMSRRAAAAHFLINNSTFCRDPQKKVIDQYVVGSFCI